MKSFRGLALGLAIVASIGAVAPAYGQVVINEIVKEERTGGAGAVTPDTREYVELYNAGQSAVNIGDWTLSTYRLSGTALETPGTYYFTDTIPSNTMLAPGDYYVIGATGVPNLDLDLGTGVELFEDLRSTVMELRSGPVDTAPIEDAVGYDMFFANGTPPAGVTYAQPTAEQAAEISRGIWGQVQSYNIPETADFKRLSMSRYQDGLDTNVNGRDFGFIPMTPGTSNNTLPINNTHTVPDVSALAPGTEVTAYNYAFIPARVADPGVVDALGSGTPARAINPSVIGDPPQGGNVIVAWDESGGGNVIYSKELVNKFDIYAYIDAEPLGIPGDWEGEWTTYGIGTTDPLFGTPNPSELIPSGGAASSTQNSNTGIGWLIQRFQEHPDQGGGSTTKLLLVDFGEGGNSVPSGTNFGWDIIEEFDLASEDSGWHHLGIDYDPNTGDVVATFGNEVRMFSTETDILGTFYAGYREGLTAVPGANAGIARPVTFVQFVPPAGLTGDYNGDGKVDAADYVVWRRDDGTTQGYNDWRANFGSSLPGAGGGEGAAAVPEPAAVALLMLGVVAAGAAARRRG